MGLITHFSYLHVNIFYRSTYVAQIISIGLEFQLNLQMYDINKS